MSFPIFRRFLSSEKVASGMIHHSTFKLLQKEKTPIRINRLVRESGNPLLLVQFGSVSKVHSVPRENSRKIANGGDCLC
jgi:hypothetical protein